MSEFTESRWQVSSPLWQRGEGGICFSHVSAENLKSPSVPLFQRGKNRAQVIVGCGATKSGNLLSSKLDAELTHEGTASFAIDAVRKLTTSYISTLRPERAA